MPHPGGNLPSVNGIPVDASVGTAGSVSAPASLLKGSAARKAGPSFTSVVTAPESAPVKAHTLAGGLSVSVAQPATVRMPDAKPDAKPAVITRLKSAFTAVPEKATAPAPSADIQSADDQLVNVLSTEAFDHYDLSLIAFNTKEAFKQPVFTAIDPTKGPMGLFVDSIRNSLMDPHGVQFGAVAGINWAGASAYQASGKVAGRPLEGFNLGLFADIPFQDKRFSLRPSLQYSYEGFQAELGGTNVNIHAAYLSLPVDVVYHTNWLSKRFYIGAGPYAAYAMNGEYSFKGINTSFQFGPNAGPDNLTRMDLGADLMAGVLLDKNFTLGAKIDYGFMNISSGSNVTVRSRSFGITLGYVFRNRANSTVQHSSSFTH